MTNPNTPEAQQGEWRVENDELFEKSERLQSRIQSLEVQIAKVTEERGAARRKRDEYRDYLTAAEALIQSLEAALEPALRYLKWQRDDHDNPGGLQMAGDCRCDWCKTVRDYFGFDQPEAALRERGE